MRSGSSGAPLLAQKKHPHSSSQVSPSASAQHETQEENEADADCESIAGQARGCWRAGTSLACKVWVFVLSGASVVLWVLSKVDRFG